MTYERAAAAMVGAAVVCMFPVVLGLVEGQPWPAAIGAFAAGFLLATARGFWQRRDRANHTTKGCAMSKGKDRVPLLGFICGAGVMAIAVITRVEAIIIAGICGSSVIIAASMIAWAIAYTYED